MSWKNCSFQLELVFTRSRTVPYYFKLMFDKVSDVSNLLNYLELKPRAVGLFCWLCAPAVGFSCCQAQLLENHLSGSQNHTRHNHSCYFF